MELKRKRGEEDSVGDDPDMVQFGLHARHAWLNNASSTMKLPWDFKLRDQLDVVDRSSKAFLRMTGVMPPIPSPEAVQSLPEEASLAVGADRSFSLKAIHRAHKRSWSEQITYERKCAYRKWIAIVSENAMAFDVARLQFCLDLWSLQGEVLPRLSVMHLATGLPVRYMRELGHF